MEFRAQGQSETARKAPGPHQTTIGRLAKGKRDPRISTLAGVAEGLQFEPWQLLVPDFDPKNPPSLLPPDLRDRLKKL